MYLRRETMISLSSIANYSIVDSYWSHNSKSWSVTLTISRTEMVIITIRDKHDDVTVSLVSYEDSKY